MARSLFNAKALPASALGDTFSFSLNYRRGYAVRGLLADLGDAGGSNPTAQQQIMREEPAVIRDESGAASSWVPDPITGFYKPSHHLDQIDPVELRAMALSHRIRTTLRQIKD
ncbi:hypothetical protein LguiA_031211 [Lonicera macranthoides]